MTARFTPVYDIEVPGPDDHPLDISAQLWRLGLSVENALRQASIPPVGNVDLKVAPSAAARNAYYGVPATLAQRLALQARGALCVRTDLGNPIETYLAEKTVTNPQGAAAAGWYPITGGSAPAPVVDDTGWLTVGAAGKVPYSASFGPLVSAGWAGSEYRRLNGVLYLGGGFTKAGSAVAVGDMVFRLPSEFCPKTNVRVPVSTTGSGQKEVTVQSDGAVLSRFSGTDTGIFMGSFSLGGTK